MKNHPIVTLCCSTLFFVACIDLPDDRVALDEPHSSEDEKPFIGTGLQLTPSTQSVYPGESFQVQVNSNNLNTETVNIQWDIPNESINLIEFESGIASFNVNHSIRPNQSIEIRALIEGQEEPNRFTIEVQQEPYIIMSTQEQNEMPIYFQGIKTGYRYTLNTDTDAINKETLASPNGRYITYIQFTPNSKKWDIVLHDTYFSKQNHILKTVYAAENAISLDLAWSPNSDYLSLVYRNDTGEQLSWFSFDTTQRTEDMVFTLPTHTEVDISGVKNHLIWAAPGNPSFGTLQNKDSHGDGKVSIFDPQNSLSPLQYNDNDFRQVLQQDLQWRHGHLLFRALNSLEHNTADLYRYSPSTLTTTKFSLGQDIKQILPFDEKSIIYQGSDNRLYHISDGGSEIINLTSVLPQSPETTHLQWSIEGNLLAVLTDPESNQPWRLNVWDKNTNESYDAFELESKIENVIVQWGWLKGDLIAILVKDRTLEGNPNIAPQATTSRLYIVDPLTHSQTDDKTTQIVSDIQSSPERTSETLDLAQKIILSPSGKWVFYWGLAPDGPLSYLDLWAYNTETNASINISQLNTAYPRDPEQPLEDLSEASTEETLYFVSDQIYWMSPSEILIEIKEINNPSVIADIRYIRLTDNDKEIENYSILERDAFHDGTPKTIQKIISGNLLTLK